MQRVLRRFLLVLSVIVVPLLPAAAQQGVAPLQRPYRPAFTEGSIRDFFADIRRQTGVPISFSGRVLDPKGRARLSGTEQTVGAALRSLLDGRAVQITERREKILIIPDAGAGRRPALFTISGFVRDSSSREIMVGAFVSIAGSNRGVATNNYGFFSLTIPAGSASRLICEFPGYNTATAEIPARGNVRRDLLISSAEALQEVTVRAGRNTRPGTVQLTLNDIEGKAAPLGESDVLRALQHQPGVQGGMEGTSSLLVRGSDPGQNLHLLDEVALYNIDHLFGGTSIFNNEAIKSVDFHKGAFPARFGGRLASVVDVHTRDGNMERFGGQASIGLLKASMFVEAPLVKEKASVTLSARRTWLDAFVRPLDNSLRGDFYDINAKANYILNANNRVYVSFYTGRDQFGTVDSGHDDRVIWGNTMGAARWTSVVSPRLFVNTTLAYSQFRFVTRGKENLFDRGTTAQGTSLIRSGSGKVQAQWFPAARHRVETGLSYSYTSFEPVSITYDARNGQPSKTQSAQAFSSGELVLYAEDEIQLGRRWMLRPGLHWASWLISSGKSYSILQPRLYASFKAGERHTLYASGAQMAQFLHLINNNTYGLPSDFWLPSTSRLKPEVSLTASAGYAANLKRGFSYNVEVYYRSIDNIITYRSGKTLFDNSRQWEQQMVRGHGWSYGAEFQVQKKSGPLLTSVAYTLSKSMRQFEALNDGNPFPYRYDRRHNLRADLVYEPRHSFSISATFTYMSGEAITLPDQIYPDLDNNLLFNGEPNTSKFTYHYTTWNNYRLPAIHRLDFAANFTKNHRRTERTWTLGLFNAYGRKNVMFVELTESNGVFSMKGYSMLRFIPTITYRLKF